MKSYVSYQEGCLFVPGSRGSRCYGRWQYIIFCLQEPLLYLHIEKEGEKISELGTNLRD